MDNVMAMPREKGNSIVRIKVMDFGFAHFFKNGKDEDNVGLWPGTPAYMAPELYN